MEEVKGMQAGDKYPNKWTEHISLDHLLQFFENCLKKKSIGSLYKKFVKILKDGKNSKIAQKLKSTKNPSIKKLRNLLMPEIAMKDVIPFKLKMTKNRSFLKKVSEEASTKIAKFLSKSYSKAKVRFLEMAIHEFKGLKELVACEFISEKELKSALKKERESSLMYLYYTVLEIEKQFKIVEIKTSALGIASLSNPYILTLFEQEKKVDYFKENIGDYLRLKVADGTVSDEVFMDTNLKELENFFEFLKPEQRKILEGEPISYKEFKKSGVAMENEQEFYSYLKSLKPNTGNKELDDLFVPLNLESLKILLYPKTSRNPLQLKIFLNRLKEKLQMIPLKVFKSICIEFNVDKDDLKSLSKDQERYFQEDSKGQAFIDLDYSGPVLQIAKVDLQLQRVLEVYFQRKEMEAEVILNRKSTKSFLANELDCYKSLEEYDLKCMIHDKETHGQATPFSYSENGDFMYENDELSEINEKKELSYNIEKDKISLIFETVGRSKDFELVKGDDKSGKVEIDEEMASKILKMWDRGVENRATVSVFNLAIILEQWVQRTNLHEAKVVLEMAKVAEIYLTLLTLFLIQNGVEVIEGIDKSIGSLRGELREHRPKLRSIILPVERSHFLQFKIYLLMPYEEITLTFDQIKDFIEPEVKKTVEELKTFVKKSNSDFDYIDHKSLIIILEKTRMRGKYCLEMTREQARIAKDFLRANNIFDKEFEEEIKMVIENTMIFTFAKEAEKMLRDNFFILKFLFKNSRDSIFDLENSKESAKEFIKMILDFDSNFPACVYTLYKLLMVNQKNTHQEKLRKVIERDKEENPEKVLRTILIGIKTNPKEKISQRVDSLVHIQRLEKLEKGCNRLKTLISQYKTAGITSPEKLLQKLDSDHKYKVQAVESNFYFDINAFLLEGKHSGKQPIVPDFVKSSKLEVKKIRVSGNKRKVLMLNSQKNMVIREAKHREEEMKIFTATTSEGTASRFHGF